MIVRKCIDCGNEMEKVKTEAKTGWGDYEVIIKGVEAFVCEKCGEKVFDSETALMLQKLGKSLSKAEQKENINVLDVEEIAGGRAVQGNKENFEVSY